MFLVLCGLLLGSIFRTMMQVNTWSTLLMIVLLLPTMFYLAPRHRRTGGRGGRDHPHGRMSEAISLGLSGQATLANTLPDLFSARGRSCDPLCIGGCRAAAEQAVRPPG